MTRRFCDRCGAECGKDAVLVSVPNSWADSIEICPACMQLLVAWLREDENRTIHRLQTEIGALRAQLEAL